MKRKAFGGFLLAAASASLAVGLGVQADEKEIDLSEVPPQVMEAATAAVAGIQITEAEVEEKDGQLVYELEGKANGVEYEIKVLPDGTVRNVEEDD